MNEKNIFLKVKSAPHDRKWKIEWIGGEEGSKGGIEFFVTLNSQKRSQMFCFIATSNKTNEKMC